MSTEEKTISLALSFAQWAVAGDWQKISDLLSSKAAGKFPPEKLKKGYKKMLAYARRADGTYGLEFSFCSSKFDPSKLFTTKFVSKKRLKV